MKSRFDTQQGGLSWPARHIGMYEMWNIKKGPGIWCPENDGAWQAEQAEIHRCVPSFKPGDRVTHNPTGEEWTMEIAYGSYVAIAGWPESHALAIDCTLICGCTTSDERQACTRACDAVVL